MRLFSGEVLSALCVAASLRRLRAGAPWGYLTAMADPTPLSPFALTPARILILALGVLALVMIIGAIMGGVGNYQALRESTQDYSSSSASTSSP